LGAILKLLLIIAVVVVAYYMYKFRSRPGVFKKSVKAAVEAAKKVAAEEEGRDTPPPPPPPPSGKVPVKLVACPKCGTYVAEGKACTCGG
jgi:hypothetical protein